MYPEGLKGIASEGDIYRQNSPIKANLSLIQWKKLTWFISPMEKVVLR